MFIYLQKITHIKLQKEAVQTIELPKEIKCFNKEELEKMAYILKAIAHPNRLMIVALLNKYGELNVGSLCEKIECGQALTSHHLTDMESKGILRLRREGRNAYYSLVDDTITRAMRCIMDCHQLNHEKPIQH